MKQIFDFMYDTIQHINQTVVVGGTFVHQRPIFISEMYKNTFNIIIMHNYNFENFFSNNCLEKKLLEKKARFLKCICIITFDSPRKVI